MEQVNYTHWDYLPEEIIVGHIFKHIEQQDSQRVLGDFLRLRRVCRGFCIYASIKIADILAKQVQSEIDLVQQKVNRIFGSTRVTKWQQDNINRVFLVIERVRLQVEHILQQIQQKKSIWKLLRLPHTPLEVINTLKGSMLPGMEIILMACLKKMILYEGSRLEQQPDSSNLQSLPQRDARFIPLMPRRPPDPGNLRPPGFDDEYDFDRDKGPLGLFPRPWF